MVTGNIFGAKVVTNKKLDKYLVILKIGENLENHDDGRMKKKLTFPQMFPTKVCFEKCNKKIVRDACFLIYGKN